MTNHPRRAGRRKYLRQAARVPRFSPFPCHICRGHTHHLPGCLTEWSDLAGVVQSVRLGDGREMRPTRLLIGPAQ